MKLKFWKKTVRVAPELEAYIYKRYEDLAVRIHADIANNRGLYNYYAPWLDYMMDKYDLPDHVKRKNSLIVTDSLGRHIGCSGAVANILNYYNPLSDHTDQVTDRRQRGVLEKNSRAKLLFISGGTSKPKEDVADSQQRWARSAGCSALSITGVTAREIARTCSVTDSTQAIKPKDDKQTDDRQTISEQSLKFGTDQSLEYTKDYLAYKLIKVRTVENKGSGNSSSDDECQDVTVERFVGNLTNGEQINCARVPHQKTDKIYLEDIGGNNVDEDRGGANRSYINRDNGGHELKRSDCEYEGKGKCEDDEQKGNTGSKCVETAAESIGSEDVEIIENHKDKGPERCLPNKCDDAGHAENINTDNDQQKKSLEPSRMRTRLCTVL